METTKSTHTRAVARYNSQVRDSLSAWTKRKKRNAPVRSADGDSPYNAPWSPAGDRGVLYTLCYHYAPKGFTQTDEPITLQEGRQLAQKLNARYYAGFPTEQFPDTLPQNIKSNPRSQYVTKPIFSLYFEYA
jgi:hypothetical protein